MFFLFSNIPETRAEYYDDYSDVLLVVNDESEFSGQIGDYFQEQRSIPESHVVHLECSTSETIDDTEFTNNIRTPIENFITANDLEGEINYIVTTKGVPLRVSRGGSGSMNNSSSVDSDLSLILGQYSSSIGANGYVSNPYYLNNRKFSRREFDFYLVTRLDGFTYEDVKNLIDNATNADDSGTFVIDARNITEGSYYSFDQDMRDAEPVLSNKGYDVNLDNTTTFIVGQENALGYYSWGSNDSGSAGDDAWDISFAPGAIGDTYVSSSGRTFEYSSFVGGLQKYDSLSWTSYGVQNYSDIDNQFLGRLMIDGDEIWAAKGIRDQLLSNQGGGIRLYSTTDGQYSGTSYTTDNGLSHNRVYDMLLDSANDQVFVATGAGCDVFDKSTSSWVMLDEDYYSGINVRALALSGNNLYVGTYGEENSSVRKYSADTLSFVESYNISNDSVQDLEIDDTYLWVATAGGLKRITLADGTIALYTTSSGLKNNSLSRVERQGDYIWFSYLSRVVDEDPDPDDYYYISKMDIASENVTNYAWSDVSSSPLYNSNGIGFITYDSSRNDVWIGPGRGTSCSDNCISRYDVDTDTWIGEDVANINYNDLALDSSDNIWTSSRFSGQSLSANLIAEGITGIKGYVYEPYATAMARPQYLYDRYTYGYNLADSFYMASIWLSWMDVVVGDPKTHIVTNNSIGTNCGGSVPCQCGNTVTESVVLTADLSCEGVGLYVGAEGITIDGNGHSITGDMASSAYGIDNAASYDNVTIKNFSNITNFERGIYLKNSTGSTIEDNVANSNTYGIYLQSSTSNAISGNTANSNSHSGILADSNSGSNEISENTANSNSTAGLNISSSSNIISGNTANSNTNHGFYINGSSNTLSENTANSNSKGISLYNAANSNTVSENMINSNSFGIFCFLMMGRINIISDNTLSLNGSIYYNFTGVSNVFTGNNFISNGKDDLGSNGTHSENQFSYTTNEDSSMLSLSETNRTIDLGGTASFEISIYDTKGNDCSNCTYEVSTTPSETVTSNKEGSVVTGSFVPSRTGTYSLNFTATDSNGNEASKNYLFFVGEAESVTERYYFRDNDVSNQQEDDYTGKSLLSEAPSETEEWGIIAYKIKNYPDEIPNYPLSILSSVNTYSWYKMDSEGSIGIQRSFNPVTMSSGTSNDYSETLSAQGSYTWTNKNFSDLNWAMNYPKNWNFLSLTLTDDDSSAYWQTTADQPSYADFNYSYPENPAIRSISNDDIIVLSATSSSTDSSHASLVLKNPTSSAASTNITLDDFSRPFLNHATAITSETATITASVGSDETSTLDSLKMEVTVPSGSLNVNVSDWNTSGTYYKAWTESSSSEGLTNVIHTIGDLEVNKNYKLKVDGVLDSNISGSACSEGICKSDSQGEITFTYTGTYSEHTFTLAPEEMEENIETPKFKIGSDKSIPLDGSKTYLKNEKIRLKGKSSVIANGTVKIYKNGDLKKEVSVDSEGKWSAGMKLKKNKSITLKIEYYNQYDTLVETKKKKVEVDDEKPEFVKFIPRLKTVSANDGSLSWETKDNEGIKKYRIHLDGYIHSVKTPSFKITAGTPGGVKNIRIEAYDKAGNKSVHESLIRVQ